MTIKTYLANFSPKMFGRGYLCISDLCRLPFLMPDWVWTRNHFYFCFLAAQFGQTSIVAYLVAKCCHINDTDSNGMTALMWSCFRANGLDPTRMLLTLVRKKKCLKEIVLVHLNLKILALFFYRGPQLRWEIIYMEILLCIGP